jgi:hypothetical protein
MPSNPASPFDQIAPLVQQQQDFLKQQEQDYLQRQAQLQAQMAPYANVDPVNQAYVAGLLGPTKSGSFFESLGNAVDASSGVLSKLRQEQLTQQDKVASLRAAQLRLALELPYKQAQYDRYMRGTGGSNNIEQQRLLIVAQQKTLEGKDWDKARNPDTGEPFASEEEFENFKNSLDSQLFTLNREARGVSSDGGRGGGGGAFPEVKSQSDFDKLGPDTVFTYKGKQYKTKAAPADQPRG